MKQLKLAIFALFLCSWAAFGQKPTNVLDSLSNLLKTSLLSDSSRADILRKEGLEFVTQGNYPKAVELFLKSKDLFQSIGNEYGVFSCDNILGVTYSYMGDQNTALNYLLKCNKSLDMGMYYDNIGFIYNNSNYKTNAIVYWRMALDFYKQKNDTVLIARLFNDLGSLLEEQYPDSAILYYNMCLKTSADKMNTSGALASLGDLYYAEGKYNLALPLEKKSLQIAMEINDLASVCQTTKMLSDIYLKMGDCKTSLILYKDYIEKKQALINEDNVKQIVRVEESARYSKENEIAKLKQDKINEIKNQELIYQKNQRNIFIGAFGIVLCLSIFLFRLFKKNKRAKIEIEKQKMVVEEKRKDIEDSIIYSSRIQRAILPPDDFIKNILPEHFIYFIPRDSVSGDFYFIDEKNNKIIWATCDATGHSVNGCLLSVLSMNILSEIVKEGETQPSKILDKLNERFNKSLHKVDDNSVRDGLDITICSFDKATMELSFSGANNPLWIIKNGELVEKKTNKMAIGQIDKKELYTNQVIQLEKGDMVYSFSDGIPDLHSEENKKFMKKRLRELLLAVQSEPMVEQKRIISETLNKFKKNAQQVDDMLLIGLKF